MHTQDDSCKPFYPSDSYRVTNIHVIYHVNNIHVYTVKFVLFHDIFRPGTIKTVGTFVSTTYQRMNTILTHDIDFE